MRVTLAITGTLAALCGLATPASAYPQFQLTTGADQCKQCHFSPAGGGLINDYGRDEAGSTISWKEEGKLADGRFLHGLWTPPASLQLGGDYRGAALFKDDAIHDSKVAGFPMQLDFYVRPAIGPVSLYVVGGFRGVARAEQRDDIDFADRLVSREHFVTYEPEGGTWYARAGRFFPIFGLRTQDHTAYIRRYTGSYVLEEPYGVAFGRYSGSSELHVSAFTKPFSDSLGVGQDHGVAAYWEKRNEAMTSAMGLQTRLTISDTDRRALVGGTYKRWMEAKKLLLMAELDVGAIQVPDTTATTHAQLLGYLSLTHMTRKGVMIGGALQGYDADLLLKNSHRMSAEANVQIFPFAHLEAHLLLRYEAVGVELGDPNLLALLQLHYYL
jgi:hypothetical protein